jgi:SAM-dependent methyltransferase
VPPALGEPSQKHCPACDGALGTQLLESRDRLCGVPGSFSIARCVTCGLGITLPPLADRELASFYPPTYGAYARSPAGVLAHISAAIQRWQAWQALHAQPLNRLAERPAGRLLDVGCGRGDLGSWFLRRGWSVVGVEPSAEACAVARSRGVDARPGTLADVALEPGAYDAVVFRQSLEHISDPHGALRAARLALRDGGVTIVSVPNFGCWQSRRFGGRWFHLDLPRHRLHFEADTLRASLAQAGFGRVEIFTSTSAVGLPASIQYALAGRCLFPTGMKLRVAVAACSPTVPLAWLLNRLLGGGDVLHAAAYTQ